MKNFSDLSGENTMDKKGMFQNLNPMALSLITFIIIVSSGAVILASFQETQTTDSLAYNITGTGLEATEDLAEWSPTIVVIGVASFIIALVAGFGVYTYASGRRR